MDRSATPSSDGCRPTSTSPPRPVPTRSSTLLRPWADAHWDIGREFGTIGARRGDVTVEVTTYRADAYDGVTRKPVVAFGDRLEDDLVRRDFTVNAMALRLPAMDFVDPYAGLADLAASVLRTPGPPEVSFGDDPLRMMRACRFAAQLGLDVAPEVRAAMGRMASTIDIVSAERVRDELTKLLLAPRPRAGLRLLVDTGLADHVLPELPALQLEIDEHHRHKDVYEHSLTVLDQAIALEGPPDGPPESVPGPDLVLRLAALLHDIGKPATRRFEPGGGVSFHHHEVVGAKLAAKRLQALRFDKDTVKAVARLTELHLRFHGYGEGQWTDSAVRRYVTDAGPLLPRLHRLTRSDSTTRNARKAALLSRTYDDLEGRIAALLEQEELARGAPRAQRQRDRRGARHPARAGARSCVLLPARAAARAGTARARGGGAGAASAGGPSSRSPRPAEPCRRRARVHRGDHDVDRGGRGDPFPPIRWMWEGCAGAGEFSPSRREPPSAYAVPRLPARPGGGGRQEGGGAADDDDADLPERAVPGPAERLRRHPRRLVGGARARHPAGRPAHRHGGPVRPQRRRPGLHPLRRLHHRPRARRAQGLRRGPRPAARWTRPSPSRSTRSPSSGSTSRGATSAVGDVVQAHLFAGARRGQVVDLIQVTGSVGGEQVAAEYSSLQTLMQTVRVTR